MIVERPDTTTNDFNKGITSLLNEDGAIAFGRMLTLVAAPDTRDWVVIPQALGSGGTCRT